MPTQALDAARPVPAVPTDMRTWLARVVAFGGALAITAVGFRQMSLVFGEMGHTGLQGVLLVLFTVTFGWIAFSATQALAGLFCGPPAPSDPLDTRPEKAMRPRVALVVPLYQEDPAAPFAALFGMGDALAKAGYGREFEIFVLSDTRDPETWMRETALFAGLRERLAGRMGVWYRRRRDNTGRKAGNIRDFIERWGARYDYMLVLDADSMMRAETVLRMVSRMDRAPRLGMLQSVPVLTGGTTLFGRLQQFAACVYGPVIARGVAAWQGLDGNYWGHNALIRTRAFAENCGLPELVGRAPFGGHVLSHDFVEAALMRRGGWEVRLDPDLEGSWEGSPPSLLDLAARDRRWAQGNLQHAKVIGARGLRAPNRAHFLVGIGAYLMSPIWLAMLLVGALLTLQTTLAQPAYFSEIEQLFPRWPTFDAARMKWLFAAAMLMLLLPKMLGLIESIADPRRRPALGGTFCILTGGLLEILLSALFAPILMLTQARQVTEILLGRDSGWSAQKRCGEVMSWKTALRRHWHHVLAGLVPALVLGWMGPNHLIWLAPVLVGLVLSPLLSRMSGDEASGRALAHCGLFRAPEERCTPAEMRCARDAVIGMRIACGRSLDDLIADKRAVARHIETLEPETGSQGRPDLDVLTARAKIDAAASPPEALSWLTSAERGAVVGSTELLVLLGQAGGRPAPHEAVRATTGRDRAG